MRPKLLAATAAIAVSATLALAEELSREGLLDRLLGVWRLASPAVSPDGEWVAYILNDGTTRMARKGPNEWVSLYGGEIWRVPTKGGGREKLLDKQDRLWGLEWSPTGRWLAYVADDHGGHSQAWALPARMGEARQITTLRSGNVVGYEWSPDGTQMAVLLEEPAESTQTTAGSKGYTGEPISLDYKDADIRDVLLKFGEISGLSLLIDPDVSGRVTLHLDQVAWDEALDGVLKSAGLGYDLEGAILRIGRLSTLALEKKSASSSEPLVIRTLNFKLEGTGYRKTTRSRVAIVDIPAGSEHPLDLGGLDAADLAWSPDGKSLAFAGARPPEPPANSRQDFDLYVVPLDGSAPPRSVVTGAGDQDAPAFSPDGRLLAFRTEHEPSAYPYSGYDLGLATLATGTQRRLGPTLDRDFGRLQFTTDGKGVLFLLEDGGSVHLARVDVGAGRLDRLVAGERTVEAFSAVREGTLVVLEGDAHKAAEISVFERGRPRLLVPANKSLDGLALGNVERWRARSADGTWVDGFVVRPPSPGPRPGPGILWLHGGPNVQATAEFDRDWQALALAGYTVIAPNPRGSSGYGTAYAAAIKGAWGTHDYDDAMAVLDAAVSAGLVDAQRLGVGGWSYGGWLTNHILTRTTRFRAAVSGAGLSNLFADLGVSDTAMRLEAELGLPWENPEAWRRQSPWFEAQKVKTPTLVLCGQDDVRTPLVQSELWYFALRRLGVETELVIYPGEGHSSGSRKTAKDKIERTIAWFDRHLAERPAP